MITFEQLVEGLVRGEQLIEVERRKRDEQKQKKERSASWPTPQSDK